MTDTSWSFNPLNILTSFGHLFAQTSNPLNANSIIKKPNIDDLTKFNLIMIEMNGVLNYKNKPIPIAKEYFNLFKNKTNIPICIINNNSYKSPKILKKNLKNQGFKLNNDIKIINNGLLTLNYLNNTIKNNNKILNNTNKIVKIGIIGESDFFYFIKNNYILELPNNINLKTKHKKVKFYWIYDNINPNNLDYVIFSQLKKTETFNTIQERVNKWIINSPKTVFLLTSTISNQNYNESNIMLNPKELFESSLINIQKKNVENYKQLDKNTILTGKENYKLIKEIIEDDYGIDLTENKLNKEDKKILLISDNLNIDSKLCDDLNLKYCLVLSGETKIQDINILDKEKIDKIDYIVPDVSYCLL